MKGTFCGRKHNVAGNVFWQESFSGRKCFVAEHFVKKHVVQETFGGETLSFINVLFAKKI